MTPKHLKSGQQAEQLALEMLQSKGLTLHSRNYRCPQGELNLVLLDPTGTLVVPGSPLSAGREPRQRRRDRGPG